MASETPLPDPTGMTDQALRAEYRAKEDEEEAGDVRMDALAAELDRRGLHL